MRIFPIPLASIALALVAALAAVAPPASAAVVQTGVGSYNLGSDSSAGATASPSSACGSGGQDALVFTGSGANNIGIHSYSCGLGFFQFGSRSSGENTYDVDGTASVIGSLTTAGGGFGFFISPGQVGAFGSTAFGACEYQESMLSIKLLIDGVVLLDDAFNTKVDTGGAQTFSHTSTGTLGGVSDTFSSGVGFVS